MEYLSFGSADFYSSNMQLQNYFMHAGGQIQKKPAKLNHFAKNKQLILHLVCDILICLGLSEGQHSHEMTLIVYHSHKHKLQADIRVIFNAILLQHSLDLFFRTIYFFLDHQSVQKHSLHAPKIF